MRFSVSFAILIFTAACSSNDALEQYITAHNMVLSTEGKDIQSEYLQAFDEALSKLEKQGHFIEKRFVRKQYIGGSSKEAKLLLDALYALGKISEIYVTIDANNKDDDLIKVWAVPELLDDVELALEEIKQEKGQ